MPVCLIGVPQSKSLPRSCLQLPVNEYTPVQHVTFQGRGSLPSSWQTQNGFWAPSVSLAQPWLLQALGKEPVDRRFLSLSLSLSLKKKFKSSFFKGI